MDGSRPDLETVRGETKTVRGPPRLFTEDVLRAMGENAANPLIFALSRPEGIAECLAQDAYDATQGRCVFASGCPVEPFLDQSTGKQIAPRPSTSAYVFPGFALGLTLAEANRVRSPMFLAAAEAVASLVTDEDLERGAVYPRVARLREVAAHVAAEVASKCFEMDGVATGGAAPEEQAEPRTARRARQEEHVRSGVQVLHVRFFQCYNMLVKTAREIVDYVVRVDYVRLVGTRYDETRGRWLVARRGRATRSLPEVSNQSSASAASSAVHGGRRSARARRARSARAREGLEPERALERGRGGRARPHANARVSSRVVFV